jgi:predicted amidohydrolase
VLFLPEATDYIARYSHAYCVFERVVRYSCISSSAAESVSLAVPVSENPLVVGLQEEARTANMAINVGIHEPVTEPANKVKNTLIWIDASGHITHRYEKLHLFDV